MADIVRKVELEKAAGVIAAQVPKPGGTAITGSEAFAGSLAGKISDRTQLIDLIQGVNFKGSDLFSEISAPTDFTVFISKDMKVHLKWGNPENLTIDSDMYDNLKFEIAYQPQGGKMSSWIPLPGLMFGIGRIETSGRDRQGLPITRLVPMTYHHTIDKFEKDKMHTFYVRAKYQKKRCATASFTIGLPSAPYSTTSYLTHTENASWYPNAIVFRWTLPADDGGAEIIRYEVKLYEISDWEVSDEEIQTKISQSSWLNKGLAFSHTYVYEGGTSNIYQCRIRAVSVLGNGAEAVCTEMYLVIN